MEFPIISTRYNHVNTFINELAPIVCNEWLRRKSLGDKTISPAVVLAQAGKESGWNLKAKTLFGIKGDGNSLNTSEFINGEYVNITDSFKAFPNLASAVQGYYDLMQWSNYDDATCEDTPEGELRGLTNNTGFKYATAPDYYETTLEIVNDFGLRVFNDYVRGSNENNELVSNIEKDYKTLDELADEVYAGLWGNGDERSERLNSMGYDAQSVQDRVNEKYYANTNVGGVEKEEQTATVEPGGSFWQIANDFLGDGNRYNELAEYNGMSANDTLYTGMVLKLPL